MIYRPFPSREDSSPPYYSTYGQSTLPIPREDLRHRKNVLARELFGVIFKKSSHACFGVKYPTPSYLK